MASNNGDHWYGSHIGCTCHVAFHGIECNYLFVVYFETCLLMLDCQIQITFTLRKTKYIGLSILTKHIVPEGDYMNYAWISNSYCTGYRKDTEHLYHAFVYSLNTSFQYLSIHAMSFIACYNYMILHLDLNYLIGFTYCSFS